MHHYIAFCVLLATATVGAHGHVFQRWLTSSQSLAPWQPADADAAGRDESLLLSAVNAALSKMTNNTSNNVMYFVETKKALFVSGEVPAPILTASITNSSAPTTNTSSSSIGIVEPSTSTSAPATSTSAPITSTSILTKSATAAATSTSEPVTSTSEPVTSTSNLTTSTSEQVKSTSAPTTSTPFTAPPGYTYSSATRSYYKYHNEVTHWPRANYTCASEGGYLVVINDAEEAEVVGRLIRANHEMWTWTGLINKRKDGVDHWRSIHGEPISRLYHNWNANTMFEYNFHLIEFAAMHAEYTTLYALEEEISLQFTCEISQ